jgi:hypothetical protein
MNNAREALAASEAEVARLEQAVEEKAQQISEIEERSTKSLAAVEEATNAIQEIKDKQENADSAHMTLTIEQASCAELMEGSYKILKEGTWTDHDHEARRGHIADVSSFLKEMRTAKVPLQLIMVEVPQVLGRKPEQRSAAAEQILQEIEAVFRKHQEVIETQLAEAAKELEEQTAATTAAQAELDGRQEVHKADVDAAAAAKASRTETEAELQGARSAVMAARSAADRAAAESAPAVEAQKELEGILEAGLAAFTMLKEQGHNQAPTENQATDEMNIV